MQISLCLGYRLLDTLHDGGEIEVRQLVNLIEHKRHEQRAQRGQHHPDDDQRHQRSQPAGYLPALDMQRREAFHERIAHDGQHGGYEYVYDDRTEIPDQKEDGRSYGCARDELQEGLGSRFHPSKEGLDLMQACDGGLRTHDRIADLDQQFAVLGY